MNLQTDLSGQISGKVQSQIGTGMPQQNGNNVVSAQASSITEADRRHMQKMIFEYLMQRQQSHQGSPNKHQQSHQGSPNKIWALVKHLESSLFSSCNRSKEEYLNMETLRNRLGVLISRHSTIIQSQRLQHVNSSPSICRMIPTPGFQQPGNLNVNGALTSEYQQSSFPPNASVNSMISSAGVQRQTTKMIPTPGLNNSSDVNGNSNNQSMNMAQPNIRTAFPAVKSSTLSPVAQNTSILHNMSDPGSGGVKSTLQHNSSVPPNGPLKVSLMNVPETREAYPAGAMLGNSPRTLNKHFEHPQLVMQDDGYGTASSNVSRSGNLPPVSSTGLVTNNQCFSAVTMQEVNSAMLINEPTAESAQLTISKPQSISQSNKINPQSQSTVRGNLLQPHQSPGKTLVQHQIEDQASSNADNTLSQSQLSPRPIILSEAKSRPQEYLRQIDENPQNNFGTQTDATLHGCHTDSKSHDVSHGSRRLPHDQDVQHVLHQRLNGHDVAQLNIISSEESVLGQSHACQATRLTEPLNMNEEVCKPSNTNREKLVTDQRNWLFSMGHARRCSSQEGKCPEPNCTKLQKLFKHIEQCQMSHCSHLHCRYTKALIFHYKGCHDANCPICIPVKNHIQTQGLRAFAASEFKYEFPGSVNGSCNSYNMSEVSGTSTTKTSQFLDETQEDFNPPIKRMKIELVEGSEIGKVKIEVADSLVKSDNIIEMKKDNLQKAKLEDEQVPNPSGHAVHEVIKHEELKQVKLENALIPSETETASKPGKPKITGVSMTEFFTPEQVQQHIKGLRQWVGQSTTNVEINQAMEHSISENSCQLCLVEKLTFEPPPLYCTPCGARIKRNAMYYTIGTFETRHYYCIPCYNESRGGTVLVNGFSISKARVEKKRNDEESGESWVQCDKCEAWQHQICALFNGKRNDCGQAEYICPKCYIGEVERGERVPLPRSAVLGAKDLPRTLLSDHLEQRLFANLEQERHNRAMIQGKSYDEVPGAESLVVRVVSSVDKKVEVKPQFLQLFKEENYPSEFPYKSKVVLLFQKIEGVEVCLFGMYLQEYGSECQQPNNRRVYLSYLDSVKYFRPEVKAVTGEALRTFVYHEMLIGYLEYCKQRGFTSCYIWACPPPKGEDYILYCHPEIQKTPKADKLREWYLSMLRKATKEKIVVEVTNLYEHFFVSSDECKAKITASRLPYFDGDYWPGAAEDIISQLQQEEAGKKQYKGAMKKTITKRALKSSGHIHFSGKAATDLMLMHQLGEIISPMKEDFIMVHLQHACKRCCIPMVSGKSWVCEECINFRLCDMCHEVEQKCEDWERHPINQKGKHTLYPVEVNGLPLDTKDKDEILESEFFDTRQAFLSLCQGNHYQYDTLRRAKHSSMIILYHLHNPSAPAFVATCNMCHVDIENGQGFRCSTCPDFDVCNSCYQKDGGMRHPHKLTNYSANDCNAQNVEARALRVMQMKNVLKLLVHASQCRLAHCQTHGCCKLKTLFRHGIICKIRANGGCDTCRKMWSLLLFHARSCKESKCTVPRCRELKEHLKRLKCQSETRRRAAVNEMMRQRLA